jgi:hypothetical protein
LKIGNEMHDGIGNTEAQRARSLGQADSTWRLLSLLIVSQLILTFVPAESRGDDNVYPLSVVATPDGVLYVADRNLPGIWKVADGKAEIYFQGSKKFRTPLNAVRCVALDAKGQLLAGDTSTREVYRFDADAKPQPLTKGGIGMPMAIAIDKEGDLFVADLEIHRIWKVPAAGGEPKEFATVQAPRGLAFDSEGRLWVVSGVRNKDQLVRLLSDGKIEVVVAEPVFDFPHNVALDNSGIAYVSDGYAKAIWKVLAGGKPEKWLAGPPLVNPVGIAWRGEHLLIVDPHAKTVFEANAEGKLNAVVTLPPMVTK